MESTINTMLPYAIKCIEDNNNIKSGTKVKGIYESYLSQFGPMSIQLGLRSTLAVYQNKSGSNNKGDRKFILDMILEVLKETSFILNNDNRETWINNHLKNTGEMDATNEQLILDASVALKRAIRTFSLTDEKSE